jgi:ABC-type transport system involved in cytochrome bd biosynthesis fused ATPase/permease subunit
VTVVLALRLTAIVVLAVGAVILSFRHVWIGVAICGILIIVDILLTVRSVRVINGLKRRLNDGKHL